MATEEDLKKAEEESPEDDEGAAAPTEGEANDALIALLAQAAGLPPRDVALVSGATARIKRLTIAGHGPTLAAALEKISGVG